MQCPDLEAPVWVDALADVWAVQLDRELCVRLVHNIKGQAYLVMAGPISEQPRLARGDRILFGQ